MHAAIIVIGVFVFSLFRAEPGASITLQPGDLVFTHNFGSGAGAVSVLDPDTGLTTMISSDSLLDSPRHLVVDEAGLIFVANTSGTIIRIDPSTGDHSVLTTFPQLASEGGLAIAPSGSLYVTARPDGVPSSLVQVDPVSGNQTIIVTDVLLSGTKALSLDEEGRFVFAKSGVSEGSLLLFDPSTQMITTLLTSVLSGGTLETSLGPGVAVQSDGDIVLSENGYPALSVLEKDAAVQDRVLGPSHICDDEPTLCGGYYGIAVSENGDIAAIIETRTGLEGVWILDGSLNGDKAFLPLPGGSNPRGLAFVPIPEPSTACLLALGLVGIAARRTRSGRRPKA